ncbi:GTP-binding protein 10 [Orchesella cincta]|uniref:GTP-binding protein 10 n=1 Tax=Orchesella cincta TaxID=48709 RepID=A0A1D2MRU6_ORCCI|nr:GTP-binding protein 10 [Orchesella cincta]
MRFVHTLQSFRAVTSDASQCWCYCSGNVSSTGFLKYGTNWRQLFHKSARKFQFIPSCQYSSSSSLMKGTGSGDEGNSQDGAQAEERKPARKEKSNSTVFYDSLRIFTKAGSGGQGLPKKGGIGGRGGDIIAVGHKEATLKKICEKYSSRRFLGNHGADAKFFCLYGEPGKPVTFPVPVGVSVVTEFGHKLGEINKHGEKVVVAKGGVGGSPANGYSAEPGQKHNVTLDLKLIADVGFVGFPNAGKSTLLKALSRASPKIASYPFTTVRPNIGVIEYPDYRQISLADLPGLIEGAHANIGMGHKFLKHVERTKVLLFVVDIHGFQLSPQFPKRSALETIVLLNRELELYKEELTEKAAILVLNKSDLPGSYEKICLIKDTLNDQSVYEKYMRTLSEDFVPDQVMNFDKIIPLSAAKDEISVNQLKHIIRKVIDINEDNETETSLKSTAVLHH